MPDTAHPAIEREQSDETLMERYAAGDARAFDALFARWEQRVYGFFLARTRSAERAEDLYQELFLRIHRARDQYDPARPFSPWLFQIAHRLLVDDHRRAFRSHEQPIAEWQPAVQRRSHESALVDRDEVEQLLRGCSAEERHVVLSVQVEGVGYGELASRLGKSVPAVRKLASRAILRLRAAAAGAASPRAPSG